jgi:hypothetical protein
MDLLSHGFGGSILESMWTRLLLLCSLAVGIQNAAWAQTGDASIETKAIDPQVLLLRVRANVTDTVTRLPKYMCTLTVERRQYSPECCLNSGFKFLSSRAPSATKSSKAVLVPKGAEVAARIGGLQYHPGPPSYVALQVKPETVSVNGTLVPLSVTRTREPVAEAPPVRGNHGLRPRIPLGSGM